MENNKENIQGRVPPQAVEIEQAVIGAMLIEHGAATIALQMLKVEDFYQHSHQHIFQTLSRLYERDNPLDLLTLENELKDLNLLEAIGGPSYLSDLTRMVSSSANIEYHAQIITEKAIKRNLIKNCTEVITESYDSSSDAYDVLDDAEQRIFDLANQKSKSSAKPVADVLKDTLAYLEDMRGKKYGITGVPSGLKVDEITAGWQKGDLVIIAARPSMGKTAFVLTAARNAAMHNDENLKTNVAIFSLEMSNQSLVQRLLTMEARVRSDEARKGTLNNEHFKDLIEAAGRLFASQIFIDDTPAITLMELRTKARRLKSEHDIGLIIIDYLQLMQGSTRENRNREQEIASISRGLKSLAKELDVPVIALSQLSRAVEQRGGDKRPQLSDLRESGSIEQDADVVMFLYRPEYYGITTTAEGQSTAGIAEAIVGKQRNGPIGSKMLYFVKDYARFENLTANDIQADFISAQLKENRLSTTGDFSSSNPANVMLPNSPIPPDDEAPF
ncbi:MAG: replicative DNA helicase [Balneola sp.]|nr:replicative DNA helicase [Balneola sp.]